MGLGQAIGKGRDRGIKIKADVVAGQAFEGWVLRQYRVQAAEPADKATSPQNINLPINPNKAAHFISPNPPNW